VDTKKAFYNTGTGHRNQGTKRRIKKSVDTKKAFYNTGTGHRNQGKTKTSAHYNIAQFASADLILEMRWIDSKCNRRAHTETQREDTCKLKMEMEETRTRVS